MGAYYDEIEIEDMAWDEEKGVYHYPCPCGDRFEITRRQLADCEDIATCPSCSLIIRVIFDPLDFEEEPSDDEEESEESEESGDEETNEKDLGRDDDHLQDVLEKLDIADETPTLNSVGSS